MKQKKANDTGSAGELHQTSGGDVPALTTQQGTPVSDDQNSLRIGARGPTVLEDFHLREKIFHFDHERIPERVVHARGIRRAWLLRNLRIVKGRHESRHLRSRGRTHACIRALLDRRGEQGLGGPGTRRPRICGEALHETRQLGYRRQQHPRVLHSGCDQIPRFDSRGQRKSRIVRFPQAQTAHDNFWDFISLTPESTHMTLWIMSDRAIPRSPCGSWRGSAFTRFG